jgi:hypothetical protein
MMDLHEPRASEVLLASIIQARIMLAANICLLLCFENHFSFMHDPAIWWWDGENQ